MGIFKKKSVDVLDLTDMQKRGLLEKSEKVSESIRQESVNEGGVLDFSGASSSGSSETSSGSSSAGDFLSSLASAGSSGVGTTQGDSPGPITDSLRNARRRRTENSEINELRLKLDDSDFKLSNLVERVKELERRLNERGI